MATLTSFTKTINLEADVIDNEVAVGRASCVFANSIGIEVIGYFVNSVALTITPVPDIEVDIGHGGLVGHFEGSAFTNGNFFT